MNIQKISGWNWKNNNSLSSFSNLQNKDQIESLKAQAMLCVDWNLCWFFKCFSVLNIHFSLATWKLIAWSHAWKLIMFDVVDDKKNQSFCWNYNSCTGFFQEKFFLFLVMIHCFVWVHFAIIIRTYREVFHKTEKSRENVWRTENRGMSVALQKQPQEVLWKKVLLKILEISQKHPVLESLFDKVAVQFY